MRVEEMLHVNPEDLVRAGMAEGLRRHAHLVAYLARDLRRLSREPDQARGYAFEATMADLFRVEGLTYETAYRRRGSQVDGALELDG